MSRFFFIYFTITEVKNKNKQTTTTTKTFVIARTYKTYLFFDLNLLEFFLNFFESSGLELQIKRNYFNALLVIACVQTITKL